MVGLVFAILVSMGVPLVLLIYAVVGKQVGAFLLGLATFVLSQIFFRIPILQLLTLHSPSYTMFSMTNPVTFAILLALSAALVEEVGRFVAMRFLLKKPSWTAAFFFGAGHGGIEAILFLGTTALVLLFSGQSGIDGWAYWIGGLERLFAILLHIGLSLLVFRSVRERRISLLCLAIFIHTFLNLLVGIVPIYVRKEMSLVLIELSLATIALALFIYQLKWKRKGLIT